MKLEKLNRQRKAVAEDARSVDSIEFPSVSGFGGEPACAFSLSKRSACHLSRCQHALLVLLAAARGPPSQSDLDGPKSLLDCSRQRLATAG